eukprot:CAMPEP_0119318242 /NCGR_PEP_ID=MMETSP1333-20130426/45871_1 /TAXON_ID=418940 /ORGANISM="Scyphosphaera apsteinii, Strain RCC1455" /LENGTH=73 /DNA_ID=CAMNT_0007324381 /DNA_START=55 /DNA_END=273 /DNA_ORIENTATION=+
MRDGVLHSSEMATLCLRTSMHVLHEVTKRVAQMRIASGRILRFRTPMSMVAAASLCSGRGWSTLLVRHYLLRE